MSPGILIKGIGSRLSLAVCLLALLSPCRFALAQSQEIKFTSSPNPVGSGARALGMGGAFIAVADDATAASWNPGGLIQLERPEISVVGGVFTRSEDNTFGGHPEASGTESVSEASLNYLSAAYPFNVLGHNMIVSLNYQHLYDFSRSWNYHLTSRGSRQTIDYQVDGGLYAWGIAYALQIIPQLSLGFTLNIWEDGIYQNAWKKVEKLTHSVKMERNVWWTHNFLLEDRYSFSGFNANLGLLWHVTDQLSLGAVFKSPFTADVTRRTSVYATVTTPDEPEPIPQTPNPPVIRKNDLDMPMSYGIGLAYRFSDRLTVSGDIYRTEWEDFVLTDSIGRETSPITNISPGKSDINATTQVRLGTEYLFIKPNYTIPVRAGLFYDPAPAQGSPDDYYGFSLGTGIGVGRFVFDAAYAYRFGRNVAESTIPGMKFSQDVDEHSFYTSLIIHF